MRFIFVLTLSMVLSLCSWAQTAPTPIAPSAKIPESSDIPFSGTIRLSVDTRDVNRRIYRIKEQIPVQGHRELVLLYPEWLPGWHSPEGRNRINRLAGLKMTSQGVSVRWWRDPINIFAFHVAIPDGALVLDIEFQYLSPVARQIGAPEVSPEMLMLEWPSVILYPAGYFSRQIQVEATTNFPSGWEYSTALKILKSTDASVTFEPVSLETLIDSPLFAGINVFHLDLDPGAAVPVRLSFFADRKELLAIKPAQIEAHRSMIQQAYRLFGAKHYDNYNFLVTLRDNIDFGGLEHHRSTQANAYATYLSEWDKTIYFRELLPHEYVHSWNGKYRRPADLWTPNYNVPMQNSLLWVYEGLTKYWGEVLTARSGLLNKEQALQQVALAAAVVSTVPGRSWRSVADTSSDEIINPRYHPLSWTTWQRFEDYYYDGSFIWLDADTLIRQLSNGSRSLDDFARSFFGMKDGTKNPPTYRFEDVVEALNAIQPFDWKNFFDIRVNSTLKEPPLDGLARGGYRLVFRDVPSDYYKSAEYVAHVTNLRFSIGLSVDREGNVKSVLWDGPAFKAGLTVGSQVLAVNGVSFEPDRLKEAIVLAQASGGDIELIVKNQDRFRVNRISYQGGLRYPHLVRDDNRPSLLDEIFSAK